MVKKVYNKNLGLMMVHPETPLEAVQALEEFLIADFGQKWSIKFLKEHFNITKKQIKKMTKK